MGLLTMNQCTLDSSIDSVEESIEGIVKRIGVVNQLRNQELESKRIDNSGTGSIYTAKDGKVSSNESLKMAAVDVGAGSFLLCNEETIYIEVRYQCFQELILPLFLHYFWQFDFRTSTSFQC